MSRHLGTGFRWLACDLCGSRESDRLELDTGDGKRVLCVHVAACDRRVRFLTLTAARAARKRRGRFVALSDGVVS